MAPTAGYTVPAMLSPPPREVNGWLSGGASAGFTRIFILPHTFVGIGATGYWLFLWIWLIAGMETTGRVLQTRISQGRKGGTSYMVKYAYEVNGQARTNSESVPRKYYESLASLDKPHPEITVKHLELWPYNQSAIRQAGSGLRDAGFFTLWVAFWES